MAKAAIYDYSTTAASNTDIDGVDSTGATGLVKSGDNYTRSVMAHAKGFALDLGAVNTVGGTADAITVTLSSSPSALVDGMRITINASAANTGAATLNVSPAVGSAFGAKKVMKWSAGSEAELSANDIPAANALIELIYDSARNAAAGAWMLLGTSVAAATTSAAGIVELATQTEAATLTDTSRAVTSDGLFFLGGYTTTATAAGTTTLTVTSTYQQYFTGTTTQTLVLPVTSTLVLGRSYRVVNNSTGAVTVQSSGANTILVLTAGASALFTCILTSGTDAASWSYRPLGITVNATPTAATSGSSVDFTGIPAWAKRITISFIEVSTNGTAGVQIQIGPSGGVETTGYRSACTRSDSGTNTNSTTGFLVMTAVTAAGTYSGTITLNLTDPSTSRWNSCGNIGRTDTGPTNQVSAGTKTVTGVLSRLSVVTTDAFDASGAIAIAWE
jgi:hypothetical protein